MRPFIMPELVIVFPGGGRDPYNSVTTYARHIAICMEKLLARYREQKAVLNRRYGKFLTQGRVTK